MGRAFEYRKNRKMKRWSSMSKAFSRIGKDILIAVRDGGPNPEANSRLRALIQNARAINMPKDNVERAIKKASNKDEAEIKELVYEAYGPHGIAIVIETATDNPNRTVANIRSYITRSGGNLGTSGSLDFLFDRKCNFKIVPKPGMDLEELELELIDCGVDELFNDEEGNVQLYGAFSDYGKIQGYLESNGFEIVSSGFERIPTDTRELTPEQEADIEKLLERIEEDDDVQAFFHNMR